MTTPDTEVKPTQHIELPIEIRIPLHSLQADIGYLFGRVAADGSCSVAMAQSVRDRLKKIERACNAYEPMREALAKLVTTSQLLLQNAEGCAVNHYGEDFQKCGRPGWLADCENDIVTARTALSTLPVNDRHHSGSDSYQADASAPALSEKFNARSEWLPIESAPHGPNLILAFRNDAGKWRRVIGWHAKQFEIEVDADELHSGLEEGPAGEAIYAKSGWYEYLDADEAPCNRIWPSHWMPLPSPPAAELNFSNEAARDGVSLKSDTSSQPASEAGKLSTDELAYNHRDEADQ